MAAVTNVALVTGATGFLGSHLAASLAADGVVVHVLVRKGADLSRLRGIAPAPVYWTGDLTDPASLERCCRGARPDVIYHLAGDTAGRRFDGDWAHVNPTLAVNLIGTLNLLRAAAVSPAPPRTVVRVGGLEEYGAGSAPYDEAQREMPRSPYSASQVAATHWCQMLQPHLGFDVVTLRPALVYGPAQSPDFLIPALIRALLLRWRFPLTDGLQRRDLIHVEDFVAAARAALGASGLGGEVINVASGEGHRIRDVAALIARLLEAEELLDIGAAPSRVGDVENLVADPRRAERLLGWRPRIPLEDGLRRTIAWYRDHLTRSSEP